MSQNNTAMQNQLTNDVVREATEHLMTTNLFTTTLDVKNRVRSQGYFATQRQVSNIMATLNYQCGWKFNQNSGYRVYRFAEDTKESLHQYFENQQQEFWEVQVRDKVQTINIGKIGTDGNIQTHNFASNREAIYRSRNLIKQKIGLGYNQTSDPRLSLKLRQQYGSHFGKKAFVKDDNHINGHLRKRYSAGYDLRFSFPNDQQSLLQKLNQKSYDGLNIPAEQKKLVGERRQGLKAFDQDGKELNGYENYTATGDEKLLSLHFNNQNIFQIKIDFVDTSSVYLSKFNLDYNTEFIPLAKKILESSKP